MKSDFVASLMALRVDVTRHSRQLTRLRRAVTVDVAAKNETVATLQRELKVRVFFMSSILGHTLSLRSSLSERLVNFEA